MLAYLLQRGSGTDDLHRVGLGIPVIPVNDDGQLL